MPTRWWSASSAGPDVGSRRGSRWPRRPAPRAQASAPWRGGCKAFWEDTPVVFPGPARGACRPSLAHRERQRRPGRRTGRVLGWGDAAGPVAPQAGPGCQGVADAVDDQRRLVHVRLETAAKLSEAKAYPTRVHYIVRWVQKAPAVPKQSSVTFQTSEYWETVTFTTAFCSVTSNLDFHPHAIQSTSSRFSHPAQPHPSGTTDTRPCRRWPHAQRADGRVLQPACHRRPADFRMHHGGARYISLRQ